MLPSYTSLIPSSAVFVVSSQLYKLFMMINLPLELFLCQSCIIIPYSYHRNTCGCRISSNAIRSKRRGFNKCMRPHFHIHRIGRVIYSNFSMCTTSGQLQSQMFRGKTYIFYCFTAFLKSFNSCPCIIFWFFLPYDDGFIKRTGSENDSVFRMRPWDCID